MSHLPKLPWQQLENWGISLQVFRTALAAGISWALAASLIGAVKPYFAPLAAILSVQATVAESVSRGAQRILGVLGGILLAMLFTRWIGLSAWSLAVLVFIAMVLATRLHLGVQGVPQVAISALMVMAVGSGVRGYAWYRALDTALGGVVAVAVSALVWPPDLTPEAAESLRLLALGLAQILEAMQHDLVEGLKLEEANRHLQKARAIQEGLDSARRGLKRAETSLRWNPWHRHAEGRSVKLSQALDVLDHSLMQVRGIARTLFVTLDRDISEKGTALPEPLAEGMGEVLALMGEALKSYAYLIYVGEQTAALRLETILAESVDARRRVLHDAVRRLASNGPRFLDIASVLVDIEKMSQDLMVSSRLIVPVAVVR